MGLRERIELYKELEDLRKRPVIGFVTGSRRGAEAAIAADAIHEFELQLEALPVGAEALDLLIVSNGGDPTVAWRIVSLIRERVKKFAVLIPAGAFSAATLIALGADSLIIHPNGNLGPVDPQIRTPRKGEDSGIGFGSEDLTAYLSYAREKVGLTDQAVLASVFEKFCEQVGPVPVAVAARSAQLSISMAEKLLKMHMTDRKAQQAKAIAEKLSREFDHHGYALSRREAKEIGLPIETGHGDVEKLIWKIWLTMVDDLSIRSPFSPLDLVRQDSRCSAVFSDIPTWNVPQSAPQQLQQAALNTAAQNAIVKVPSVKYKLLQALMESPRIVSHFTSEGVIFGSRNANLQVGTSTNAYRSSWESIDLPNEENGLANGD